MKFNETLRAYTQAHKTLLNCRNINNEKQLQKDAQDLRILLLEQATNRDNVVDEFYSMPPRYRTKERLKLMLKNI